jgi:hypothetical protein
MARHAGDNYRNIGIFYLKQPSFYHIKNSRSTVLNVQNTLYILRSLQGNARFIFLEMSCVNNKLIKIFVNTLESEATAPVFDICNIETRRYEMD